MHISCGVFCNLAEQIKKNRSSWSSWLVSKQCESERSSEEDQEVSASEEEAVTETDSESESISEIQESSCYDDSSADERKRRINVGKPKPALSHSSVTKPSKKASKKLNKRKTDGTRIFRKKRWRIFVESWKRGENTRIYPSRHFKLKAKPCRLNRSVYSKAIYRIIIAHSNE